LATSCRLWFEGLNFLGGRLVSMSPSAMFASPSLSTADEETTPAVLEGVGNGCGFDAGAADAAEAWCDVLAEDGEAEPVAEAVATAVAEAPWARAAVDM
jgi:hypothetical protein